MNLKNVKAIELVLFKPKSGVRAEDIKFSLTSLNSIIKSYDGFVGRQLAVGKKISGWIWFFGNVWKMLHLLPKIF